MLFNPAENIHLCNRQHTFMQQETYIYATGNIHLCNRKKLKKLFLVLHQTYHSVNGGLF